MVLPWILVFLIPGTTQLIRLAAPTEEVCMAVGYAIEEQIKLDPAAPKFKAGEFFACVATY